MSLAPTSEVEAAEEEQAPVTPDQPVEQETPVEAAAPESAEEAAPEAAPFDFDKWYSENHDHPTLKKLQADSANAAIQRARREAGRNEVTAQRLEEFASKFGVDTSEMTKEQRAQFGFLADANARHLSVEAMKGLAQIALENAPDQIKRVSGTIEQLADLAERSPDDFGEFTMRLFDATLDARSTEKLANSTLKDVPEGSQLRKDITAEVQRLLTLELKAAGIEGRPKGSAPPAPPVGSAIPVKDSNYYRSMSEEQIADLAGEERDSAYKALGWA